MSNIFNNIEWVCCLGHDKQDQCICAKKEMVVRRCMVERAGFGEILNSSQRKDFIDDAVWCGEGFYSESELENLTDGELAEAVMNAWKMYANSHGF